MSIRFRTAALALAIGSSWAAVSWAQGSAALRPEAESRVEQTRLTAQGALRKDLAYGVYQAIYNPADQGLYIASAQAQDGVRGGALFKLDPITLDVQQTIYTDEKNFGLALNTRGDALFVTNSLSSSIARVELGPKASVLRHYFTERSGDGTKMGPRTVRYDASKNRLYVGAVGWPSVVWVLDADTLQVLATIENAGKWVTGLQVDPMRSRLYVGNGEGEILVVNTDTFQTEQRWRPERHKQPLWLNFALDEKRGLLYVSEGRNLNMVLALDAETGQIKHRLPIGESMDVLYNPERDELYISHRQQAKVSVLDAADYRVKAQYDLGTYPNSLALGADQQLYVTVKEPFTPSHQASAPEQVVRIDLRTLQSN